MQRDCFLHISTTFLLCVFVNDVIGVFLILGFRGIV